MKVRKDSVLKSRAEVGVIRGSDVFVIRVDWCPFVVKSGKSVGKFS